jgi:DNA-binding NarL/FixJ family response regulator
MNAPYATARARELIGLAFRAVHDEDGARLEIDAAREEYARLGASRDAARLGEALDEPSAAADATHGAAAPRPGNATDAGSGSTGTPTPAARARHLTPRELEVLRLVAAGKTNKAVAAELFISERTVDRHVSNILTKLDVTSRAAATAFAYEHRLL